MGSEPVFKNCQSCGMPLKRDDQGGGTNADGTRSTMYCSHCYQRGRFTLPDLTAEQMQARVKGKLKEFGFPGFLAGLFTRNIPRLERWKSGAESM
jgi:Putative zinc ribbon domain